MVGPYGSYDDDKDYIGVGLRLDLWPYNRRVDTSFNTGKDVKLGRFISLVRTRPGGK